MKTGIAAFVLVTISALATDLTGNWSGSFKVDGGDHNVPQCFTLRQQGKSLSGSGGPDASEQYPIEKGSVEGNQITFQVTTGEWKFTYHLRQLSADTLKGDLKLESVNDSRTAKVSLTRVKRD
jgi:hypothetical protein